ncbi:MAG: HAD family phosphatase [Eubacterium sp.]|nr:HAD family phosphatase [Eubacterium sp.]
MKLIIFDMDGLMFDTEAIGFRAYEECGEEWGLPTGFPIYLSLIGLDKRDTCAKYREIYGEDMDADLFYREVGNRIREIMEREGIPMKPGLLPLLEAIEEAGIPKMIASSTGEEGIRNYLKRCRLEDRFDGILSAEEVKRGKPFPDVFLAACRKMGVKPEEALVLEDSPAGICAAHSGNIPVIAIPDLKEIPEDIRKKCVMVGETLEDVIPYIREQII